MDLDVGLYVALAFNYWSPKGKKQRRLILRSKLISKIITESGLVYFFLVHDPIRSSDAVFKTIIAWQKSLPIISSSEFLQSSQEYSKYRFIPICVECATEITDKEIKLNSPYYAEVTGRYKRDIRECFNRDEMVAICTYNRIYLHNLADMKKNAITEELQKNLTFFKGRNRRNIKSISCDGQEGIVYTPDSMSIDSFSSRFARVIHFNEGGLYVSMPSQHHTGRVRHLIKAETLNVNKEGEVTEERPPSQPKVPESLLEPIPVVHTSITRPVVIRDDSPLPSPSDEWPMRHPEPEIERPRGRSIPTNAHKRIGVMKRNRSDISGFTGEAHSVFNTTGTININNFDSGTSEPPEPEDQEEVAYESNNDQAPRL